MLIQWLKNNKTEVWIFLLAFGVRFLYAVFVQIKFGSHGFLAYSDAFSFYLPLAKNLVEHGIFSMSPAQPYVLDAYRVPLYPLFLAGFLWLKLPLFAVVFAQNVLAGLMAVLIYRIGILIFERQTFFDSRNISIFAAILTSIEPMSIYWNNLLMSDYLFAFLFILAFYYFVLKRYYLFAFVFGLATLTRSVGLYFFPLFLVAVLWQKIAWKKIVLTAFIFMAALFPWMLRNKIIFDTWELSSASWYNVNTFLTKRFADSRGIALAQRIVPAEYPHPETFSYDFINTPFYKEQFFKILRERPAAYFKFHLSLMRQFILVNPYQYLADYVIKPKFPAFFYGISGRLISTAAAFGGALWAVFYVFALLGILAKKQRVWFCLILLVFLANAASVGALGLGSDMSRYMLPLAPFILLFAGAGFGFLYEKFGYGK